MAAPGPCVRTWESTNPTPPPANSASSVPPPLQAPPRKLFSNSLIPLIKKVLPFCMLIPPNAHTKYISLRSVPTARVSGIFISGAPRRANPLRSHARIHPRPHGPPSPSPRPLPPAGKYPTPYNIFLFHSFLAGFFLDDFRFSSLFGLNPPQPPRRALGYDGCHASPLRR